VKDVADRHEAAPAEDYVDDGKFKRLVYEMLDARAAAVSSLLLYLEDESQFIQFSEALPLREAHRSLIAYRERALLSLPVGGEARRAQVENVCTMQGLVLSSALEVDEAGEGPLERAAADGSVGPARVELLLAAGVSAVDWSKALPAAAKHGRVDAAVALIGALGPESVKGPVRLLRPN
jgi:hypothetical protein